MEIDTSTTHPNPQPNLHHRKIELQFPLDLAYLQAKLSASAQQKLDLHFPPTAYRPHPPPAKPAEFISLDGPSKDAPQQQPQPSTQTQPGHQSEEDPLRKRVRQIVDAFLDRTWAGAAHSISINGMDATALQLLPTTRSSAEPPPQQQANGGQREGIDYTYSAYDGKLQQRVASLYGELEMLTAQVSRLRREAPKQRAEAYQKVLGEGVQDDERGWEETRQRVEEEGKQEKGVEMGDVRDGWHKDTKDTYERGVNELGRLAGLAKDEQGRGCSLTEAVGKVQRARTVAVEFE